MLPPLLCSLARVIQAPNPAHASSHPTTCACPCPWPTHRLQAVAAAIAAEKAKKEVEAGKRDPEAPPDPVVKEDRIAIQRTIGRKQPVKYYITGGWVGWAVDGDCGLL